MSEIYRWQVTLGDRTVVVKAEDKLRATKRAAQFEPLCDTMGISECSRCGLLHDGRESPFFTVRLGIGGKRYELGDMRFCPRCGAPLR